MRKRRFTRCYRCKKRARLFRCKLCGKYFCKYHSDPKMVLMPQAIHSERDRELRHILFQEYRRKGNHPCWAYNEVKLKEFKDKRKEDFKKLKEFLDKMKTIRPRTFPRVTPPPKLPIKLPRRKTIKRILTIVIFLIILYLIYANQNVINLTRNYLNINLSEEIGLFLFVVLIFFIILFFISRIAFKIVMFTVIAIILVILFVYIFGPFIQAVGKVAGKIEEEMTGTSVNSEWVNDFISAVNVERQKKGLQPLTKSTYLDSVAYARFNTMVEHYGISHYGAESYQVFEVVFYPVGFTPQDYVTDIQNNAPLHWQILIEPLISNYGYYVGSGPVVQLVDYCSVTEIPGPNINVVEFFQQHGCQTEIKDSIWLVIDMI